MVSLWKILDVLKALREREREREEREREREIKR